MPIFWGIILIIVTYVLQTSVVSYFRIFQVQPDLMLILVLSYAFFKGPRSGATTGFFGGLIEDLVSLRGFGINALSRTIVGYLSGLLEKTVFVGNIYLFILVVVAMTLVNQLVYMGLIFIVGYTVPFTLVLWRFALPSALYTGLVASFLYLILEKLWFRTEGATLEKPKLVKEELSRKKSFKRS